MMIKEMDSSSGLTDGRQRDGMEATSGTNRLRYSGATLRETVSHLGDTRASYNMVVIDVSGGRGHWTMLPLGHPTSPLPARSVHALAVTRGIPYLTCPKPPRAPS